MSLKITDHLSASDFLAALRPGHADWHNRDGRRRWVFRGQRDAALSLIPTLCRPNVLDHYPRLVATLRPRAEAALTRHAWWGADAARAERAMDMMTRALLQTAMVREFAEFADQLGYPVGDTLPPTVEDLLLSNDLPLPSWPAFTPTPAIALAQHHGIPTLLLDWTWNPLVAAYFAVADAEKSKADHVGVFVVDVTALRVLVPYHCPRHRMEFLHAQHGLFLHLRVPWGTFNSMHRWAAFDEVEEQQDLRCLRLPIGEAGNLKELLSYELITRAHLMPTLDNVVKTVKAGW